MIQVRQGVDRNNTNSIRNFVVMSIATIALLSVAMFLTIFFMFLHLNYTLKYLNEVIRPIHLTAHEMEINVNGGGLAVLGYLDGAPAQRQRVEEDNHDFYRALAVYQRLVLTPEEKNLGRKIEELYQQYSATAITLMQYKDAAHPNIPATAEYQLFCELRERIDDVLDDEIQHRAHLYQMDVTKKVEVQMQLVLLVCGLLLLIMIAVPLFIKAKVRTHILVPLANFIQGLVSPVSRTWSTCIRGGFGRQAKWGQPPFFISLCRSLRTHRCNWLVLAQE